MNFYFLLCGRLRRMGRIDTRRAKEKMSWRVRSRRRNPWVRRQDAKRNADSVLIEMVE